MTRLIISLIGLAAAGYALWLATRQNRKYAKQIEGLQADNGTLKLLLDYFGDLCRETDPQKYSYAIQSSRYERTVVKSTGGFKCIIKRFNDADEDFNQRCAEELLETLNSK